jgi:hypothetical protein
MKPEPSNLNVGFTQADLEKFHLENGKGAYICSFRGCPRSSDGFPSKAEREKHESYHSRPYRCNETNCDFSTIGFATRRSLQKHSQTYHTTIEQSLVPRFGRMGGRSEQDLATTQQSLMEGSNSNFIPDWPDGRSALSAVRKQAIRKGMKFTGPGEDSMAMSGDVEADSVVSAGAVPRVQPVTPYLHVEISKLKVLSSPRYSDILDQIDSSPGLPEPIHLEILVEQLRQLSEAADARSNVCNDAMRELADRRKAIVERENKVW